MTARRSTDRGMTLVELVVVMSIVGLVTLVIAATFIVILRVAPATEFRIDDARSTRGLQTWLVRDIASTPPRDYDSTSRTGFVASDDSLTAVVPAADLCTTDGTHVLFLAWVDSGISYRAQYTLVGSADTGYSIDRHLCGGDTATVGVTGDIESTTCSADPLSLVVPTSTDGDVDPDSDGDGTYEGVTVELCLVSTRVGSIAARTPTSKEITLSVASRNGDI